MSTEQKVPKRLRILPHCSIDGVRPGKRLHAGLYVTGQNLSEEEASILASEEFAHCVEVLPDQPPPEPLAEAGELPKALPGYIYSRKKMHEQEQEEWARVHGRTHPPDEIEGERYK